MTCSVLWYFPFFPSAYHMPEVSVCTNPGTYVHALAQPFPRLLLFHCAVLTSSCDEDIPAATLTDHREFNHTRVSVRALTVPPH